ncbi:MAG: hypothetical protein LLF76_10495 [Planctomycetaceae bacterium]|nr:hypothetical protein [Planctomycetaceae bacterium]
MNHLTEDRLIKYQFNLLDDASGRQVAEHLKTCEQCRRNLSDLKLKFSVLDVLEEDADLPQTLTAATLAQCNAKNYPPCQGGVPRRGEGVVITTWARPTLLTAAAAAAVLLIGFFWLHRPSDTTQQQLAEPYFAAGREKKVEIPPQSLFGSKREEMDQSTTLASADSGAASQLAAPGQPRILGVAEIPDKPPFAPASSIELVILPRPEATQVTIYNAADLTLVRDTRRLTLKPGWNWLQFMWANTKIDPTSLSLRPLEYADKVSIEQLTFPPRVRELGRWLIRSEVEGSVPFEITYFTSGLRWTAAYDGTLSADETAMDLKGYVRVANNSGQDYLNAQTRLLLGQVRLLDQIAVLAQRKNPYGPDVLEERLMTDDLFLGDKKKDFSDLGMRRNYFYGLNLDRSGGGLGGALFDQPKNVEKQGLSEYFLYTIEGAENLTDAWGKRLQSMEAARIPVKSLYKYDEERYGNQTVRFVSFKNDKEHELGETPLPEGRIKIFRNLNDVQNLSYVGQSAFKYIPVNENVELNIGTSPLVKIEPKLMDVKTANHTFDKDNNINGWDEIETWQFKLTNTRDIPADIEITRVFNTDTWDLQVTNSPPGKGESGAAGRGYDSVVYRKHDKRHARFTAKLAPRSEETFTYVITKYQGQRSEFYVQKQREQSNK